MCACVWGGVHGTRRHARLPSWTETRSLRGRSCSVSDCCRLSPVPEPGPEPAVLTPEDGDLPPPRPAAVAVTTTSTSVSLATPPHSFTLSLTFPSLCHFYLYDKDSNGRLFLFAYNYSTLLSNTGRSLCITVNKINNEYTKPCMNKKHTVRGTRF